MNPAQLDASFGRRTTRLRRPPRPAFVFRKLCGHRISPRVRDDRDPPLSSGETGGFKSLICPTRQEEFFPLMGLTDFWVICPSCCFVARGPQHYACVRVATGPRSGLATAKSTALGLRRTNCAAHDPEYAFSIGLFANYGHAKKSPRPFPCLQLVWPDSDGRFPWQAGFDASLKKYQPLLKTFS
jgi:uncharacterized protein DUF4262